MRFSHQGIYQIECTLLRQKKQDIARCLAINAQKNTYHDGIRAADQIRNSIQRNQRDFRHIHINAAVNDLRQRRSGIPGTDIADLPQSIQLSGGKVQFICHNLTPHVI